MGAFPSTNEIATSGQRLPLLKLASAFQRGTATLVAGTVTVTGVAITSNSTIMLTRNTPGGTVGDLDARDSNRTAGDPATGQFIITSDSGTDTSTVDYLIIG